MRSVLGQSPAAVPTAVALAAVLAHLPWIQRYGWFRDELYYVVCSERLAFGYVDHPPLVAAIAWVTRALLGDSLAALRLPAILAGGVVVFLSGWMARELGGGRLAQAVAGICVAIAPVFLFTFHVYSMNAFDVLFWTLGALVVIRILKTGNGRLWLLFGAIAGLGLQNKHSMLFFGLGIVVGLLLTPERRHVRGPWLWMGGAIATLISLPHVIWQAVHGWPALELIANATANKNVALGPLPFMAEEILQMHPLTFPVWLGGLAWLFGARAGRPFRPLGWMYLAVLVLLLSQRSKPYYLAPAYPVLFAAGGTGLERVLARLPTRQFRTMAAAAVLTVLIAGGAALAPMTLPVLSVNRLIAYLQTLGPEVSSGERHEQGALPQDFADMHGWEAMAELARVHSTLPTPERAATRIFAQNYGEAGAVNVLGRRYGLPPAISGHTFSGDPGNRSRR